MTNSKTVIFVVAVVVVALFLLCMFGGKFHYGNKEIRARNLTYAQQQVCMAFYDAMWKIIQQEADVADQYKQAFENIYPEIMEGRYGNARGGALLSFIQESNPNFDIRLYENLQNAIEAKRTEFFNEQKKLIDLQLAHKNIIQLWPGRWFVGDRDTIVITVITSAKTKEAYQTGEENKIDVFQKK